MRWKGSCIRRGTSLVLALGPSLLWTSIMVEAAAAAAEVAEVADGWKVAEWPEWPIRADHPSCRDFSVLRITFMWIDRMCIRGEKQNLVLLRLEMVWKKKRKNDHTLEQR